MWDFAAFDHTGASNVKVDQNIYWLRGGIRELYTKDNHISQISPVNLPKNLKVLDLRNNSLRTLSLAALNEFDSTNTNLSNNPWTSGRNLREMVKFMNLNRKRILDFKNL